MGGVAVQVDKHYVMAGIGGGIVLIVLYLAMQSTGDGLVSVPEVQTEAQFDTHGADFAMASNTAGQALDMTPEIHFYDEGWNCPGQHLRAPRHRYPVVSGGNISTVMHRGMASLAQQSPDNPWRVTPPSEDTL
jgi:hypothetical protein